MAGGRRSRVLPVGAAFYTWDYGVKKGNIQILGVASYSAPVLSTLVLIVAGFCRTILAHFDRLPAGDRRGADRRVGIAVVQEAAGLRT